MEKMTQFKGDKAKFLPEATYKDKMTLARAARIAIDLYYFGAGHTNGDTFVVFPALRVAHTGDMFARAGTPLIDVANGGSGVAYPETIGKAAAGIKGVDTVIAGHTPQRRDVGRVRRSSASSTRVPRRDEGGDRAPARASRTPSRAQAAREVQGLRHAGRQGQRHEDLRRAASPSGSRHLVTRLRTTSDASSALAVAAASLDAGRQPRPFQVEETTIAQIHAAMKAGRLTCRALVERTCGASTPTTRTGRRSTPSSWSTPGAGRSRRARPALQAGRT